MVGFQDIIDTGAPSNSNDQHLIDIQARLTGTINKDDEAGGDETDHENEVAGSTGGPFDEFADYGNGASGSGTNTQASKATADWTLEQIMRSQGYTDDDEELTELDGMGNGGVDWPTGGRGKKSKAMERKEADGESSTGKKGIQAKERKRIWIHLFREQQKRIRLQRRSTEYQRHPRRSSLSTHPFQSRRDPNRRRDHQRQAGTTRNQQKTGCDHGGALGDGEKEGFAQV